MTHAVGLAATCLVALTLGGCAVSDVRASDTLPPMLNSQGKSVHQLDAQQSAGPRPASNLVAVNSDLSGLDPYPSMRWLLTASGVLDEIGARPATVFAPSENAFRNFAVIDTFGLMSNPLAFAPILRRHVVLGVWSPDELVAAGTVTNLAGEQLTVRLNGHIVMVNEIALDPPVPDFVAPGPETLVVYGADRVLLFAEGTG